MTCPSRVKLPYVTLAGVTLTSASQGGATPYIRPLHTIHVMPRLQRLFDPRDPTMLRMRTVFKHGLPPLRSTTKTPSHYFKHYANFNEIPDVFDPLLLKLPFDVDKCSAQRVECIDTREVHVPAIIGRGVFCVMRENVTGGMITVERKAALMHRYELAPGELLIFDDEDPDYYKVTNMQRVDCDFEGVRDVLIF